MIHEVRSADRAFPKICDSRGLASSAAPVAFQAIPRDAREPREDLPLTPVVQSEAKGLASLHRTPLEVGARSFATLRMTSCASCRFAARDLSFRESSRGSKSKFSRNVQDRSPSA